MQFCIDKMVIPVMIGDDQTITDTITLLYIDIT